MTAQLFDGALAADQPTSHHFKISHPGTVVLAGLRRETSSALSRSRIPIHPHCINVHGNV
jgi:hypothetical protein